MANLAVCCWTQNLRSPHRDQSRSSTQADRSEAIASAIIPLTSASSLADAPRHFHSVSLHVDADDLQMARDIMSATSTSQGPCNASSAQAQERGPQRKRIQLPPIKLSPATSEATWAPPSGMTAMSSRICDPPARALVSHYPKAPKVKDAHTSGFTTAKELIACKVWELEGKSCEDSALQDMACAIEPCNQSKPKFKDEAKSREKRKIPLSDEGLDLLLLPSSPNMLTSDPVAMNVDGKDEAQCNAGNVMAAGSTSQSRPMKRKPAIRIVRSSSEDKYDPAHEVARLETGRAGLKQGMPSAQFPSATNMITSAFSKSPAPCVHSSVG
ncbi:hypothetical protein K437DRAFT_138522 [Tilletiaria anomala UBC 951]|uniref:Uncharacterized protein n=1 Tax=Tilletiaria anomala (strain ATCC 24038 / CBS 436.72 / UBC 951) TaxID=1037660 RepID=A0A066VSF3_TILAU|nr:uncharacterized protein K437DRAFT_138522 [Tilletiaria anomala UBC 951]KDN44366.1 hypothetical protein K437DRAFT_138522 [Tilletiaria anomala UBC 951]